VHGIQKNLFKTRRCVSIEYTTIAFTCMKIFRKNFLREEEIGIISPGGYKYKDNYLHKALHNVDGA